MKLFYTSVPILFILTALAISCSNSDKKSNAGPPPKPPTPKVEGFIVKTMMVSDKAELPGSIIANETTEIHSEVSGRLVYLNINEGKTVGKGALLAKIYDGDLQAQLKKLNVQVAVAEQTVKRMGELLKIGGVSQQEYDLSVLQVNTIRADMDIVRTNISRTEIRAPFSGSLGLKNISSGAYITPATTITTIRQNSQLKLDFTLPEKFTSSIKTGQMVDFMVEGNPKRYTARVMATESGLEENTRSLNIRCIVTNNDGKLLPGVFAKVMSDFNEDPNGLMIPSQAILPQARGKKVILYQSGMTRFVDITTGIRDSALVQVVSGLNAGDTIITTGLMSLKPDIKVEITKINQ
ncbi:MAG: efflux RND transporter periplasmic adaptor subunit [Chitinophagaceae bacterium]|nr:efflux RND transporter periplasmic adaptor subunit [Chitinophagaceae bacterium]